MYPEQKELYKVFRAGDRSFPVYLEYDEQLQESYPAYPDFEECPEYTGEGRPFATAEQESCPHCKPKAPGKSIPGDCGGCGWFYREETPYDLIGICTCDARRRENELKIRGGLSMKKFRFYYLIAVLILAIALAGCGGGEKSGGNGDSGGSNDLKTAEPYPTRSVRAHLNTKSNTFTDKASCSNYFTSIFGDPTEWPQAAKDAYGDLGMVADSVIVDAQEYQMVCDEVFFEYSFWYEPNSTLNITLSSINEKSVATSITQSVGITMGGSIGNITGSITKETTKTVTTAKGIEVATSYDLTKYDQSKQYKIILKGNYASVRYMIKTYWGYEMRSNEMTYGINVYNDTLAVKLVHN